jgi:hypothetical protein
MRTPIQATGTRLAFVHLGTPEKAKSFFAPHNLDDLARFSDPRGALYESFGLTRASIRQYFNLETFYRILIAWFEGHFVGLPEGDVQRMPGVFLLHHGEVVKSFRHKLVSDRPNYLELASRAPSR